MPLCRTIVPWAALVFVNQIHYYDINLKVKEESKTFLVFIEHFTESNNLEACVFVWLNLSSLVQDNIWTGRHGGNTLVLLPYIGMPCIELGLVDLWDL